MHGFDYPFEGYHDGDDFRDDDRLSMNDEQRMREHQRALRRGRADAIRARASRPAEHPLDMRRRADMDEDARVSLDAAMWESVEHFTDEVWTSLTPEALYEWSGRGPIIR